MGAGLAVLRDLLLRMLPHPTRPGLRRIGRPGPDSPVLVTCNFALTVRRLERTLAGRDVWLLVADSRGINVWCAATGGHLTHHDVISVIRTSGIDRQVRHRELLLPQLAATGVERRRITEATGWETRWGPAHLEDLPEVLDRGGHLERRHRRVRFPLGERLEMAAVWAVPVALVALLALGLPLGWILGGVAAAVAVLQVTGVYVLLPWIPVAGRRRWWTVAAATVAGFALGSLALVAAGEATTGGRLGALGAACAAAMLVLSVDLAGTTPWYPSDVNTLGNRFSLALVADRCTGVAECVQVCPTEVLAMDGHRHRVEIARPRACVLCGACIVQCPEDALLFRFEDGRVVTPATVRRTRVNLLGRRTVEVEGGVGETGPPRCCWLCQVAPAPGKIRAMNREDAFQILTEHVEAEGLRRHMVAVEAAMRGYAGRLGEDPEIWGLAGLLHDFDWEIHPTLEDHPAKGAPILRQRGVPETVVQAILSHNTEGTGVERQRPIDYALLACDEVTGLIIASALVRPSKDVRDVKLKSLKKRWKEKAFARGVDREHVEEATTDFSRECFDGGLDLWQHVQNVLESMQGAAVELDLDGRLAG